MAGIKLDLSTKSGLVTAAGIGILIIGLIFQIVYSAQTGQLKTGFHMGFNASNFSPITGIILALGFIVLAIGIVWRLIGEEK